MTSTAIDHSARAHSSVGGSENDGHPQERQLANRKAEACSVEELRSRITYDPETGIVRWRTAIGVRTHVGAIVGWANDKGYLKFKIGTTPYFLSRAIWAYVYGYWPSRLVDHRNGIKADNRLSNLRLATNKQNMRNSKVRRDGLKGATWSIAADKWAAQIGTTENGRKVNNHLGVFDTEEAAHLAYCKAAIATFGEYARFE